jgi:hypothetical protein
MDCCGPDIALTRSLRHRTDNLPIFSTLPLAHGRGTNMQTDGVRELVAI